MTLRFSPPSYGGRDDDGFDELPAVPGDRMLKLRLVEDLLSLKWPMRNIASALEISERTVYRRKRELKRLKSSRSARPSGD